jgi:hypothetical protein
MRQKEQPEVNIPDDRRRGRQARRGLISRWSACSPVDVVLSRRIKGDGRVCLYRGTCFSMLWADLRGARQWNGTNGWWRLLSCLSTSLGHRGGRSFRLRPRHLPAIQLNLALVVPATVTRRGLNCRHVLRLRCTSACRPEQSVLLFQPKRQQQLVLDISIYWSSAGGPLSSCLTHAHAPVRTEWHRPVSLWRVALERTPFAPSRSSRRVPTPHPSPHSSTAKQFPPSTLSRQNPRSLTR